MSQQIRLVLCHNFFILYSDEYDNDDEIDEHQPFPSLSQVISFLQLPKSNCLFWQCWWWSQSDVPHPPLFPDIPRCSRTCGFQHWDQMDLSDESEDKCCQWCSHLRIKCSPGDLDMFLFALFPDRMGHGIATCHPTSTWTPTLISSCPVFCSKLDRDALSSPALTQTSAQCVSRHPSIADSLHLILESIIF